jgi:hypothetical protein
MVLVLSLTASNSPPPGLPLRGGGVSPKKYATICGISQQRGCPPTSEEF